jgi:hypothetical protein
VSLDPGDFNEKFQIVFQKEKFYTEGPVPILAIEENEL